MVKLNIDSETFNKWQQKAVARGLTVEAWLRQQVEPDLPKNPTVKASEMTPDEWSAWLKDFANRHPPTGYPVDDSRESIYD
ncbi:hypothetical protein [Lacunimicrobium album]